jgi:uncharacterized membrane protein YhaH (DUF805 family)
MTLIDFFLSPSGRISRQAFWLGIVVLMAVSLPIMAILDPSLATGAEAAGGQDGATPPRGPFTPPSLAGTIWSLIITWPSAAISIKRFNDRDWPHWVGYVLGAAMALLVVAHHFGVLLDPNGMASLEYLVFMAILVFFTWSLIDNGFYQGTSGANRYGPDPLAPTRPRPAGPGQT